MKLEVKNTISALKARLRRERLKTKGLAVALNASKISRDNFANRYWELRKASKGIVVDAKTPSFNPRYRKSYEAAFAHLTRFINSFKDGEDLYFYLDPGNIVGRPIDNLIVQWRIVKKDSDLFDLEFVEEIKLVV